MSTSMTRKGSAKKPSRKILISLLLVFLGVVIILLGSLVTKLTYNKVYEGVFLENTAISGLTEDELKSKIPELFDKRLSKEITLKIDTAEVSFDTLMLSPALDVDKMTELAFSYGRSEKFLSRLGEINDLKKNNKSVPFILAFNDGELQKIIDEAIKDLDVTATPNEITYGDDCLIITRGTAGNGILFKDVKSAIEICILDDKDVAEAEFKYIEPEEITYDYLLRYTSSKPISASYSIENHRLNVIESKPGVTLIKEEVDEALKNSVGNEIKVPAKITKPELSSDELNETLLAHELGKFSTDYSSSSNDRAYNIKLACEKINGYILAPGDEFSYNDVVGPRTVERGFRIANVYVGNTVQPGIGGGICQVSSTMYNAVVFADLEITERRNHTLPVSYVPMGRDATVSYGTTDFRFKNNTSMPVEIRATAQGGINTITIIGTDEHPEREIKIETARTGTSSPKVVIKENPELMQGEIVIESEGTTGSSHVAYKVVYENGKEVSRTHLSKSTYRGKDRIEIHGTKVPEIVPEIPENPENVDSPVQLPDQDNTKAEEVPAV